MSMRLKKYPIWLLISLPIPLILLGWLLYVWPSTRGTSLARNTIVTPSSPAISIQSVLTLMYSPDGQTIAGVCDFVGLWLFDIATGKVKGSYGGQGDYMGWSRDGRRIVVAEGRGSRFNELDMRFWVLDSANPDKYFKLPLAMKAPGKSAQYDSTMDTTCIVSPDAALAGCGVTHNPQVAWKDGAVAVWDIETKQRHFYQSYAPTEEGLKRSICGLAFSPDNKKLAVASLLQGPSSKEKGNQLFFQIIGAEVTLLNVDTGQAIMSLGWPNVDIMLTTNMEGSIDGLHNGIGLAFSPDGTRLAGADANSIRLWDINSGAMLHQMEVQEAVRSGGFRRVLFSPDSKLIAGAWNGNISGSQNIEVWNADTGRRRQIFHPLGHCQALAFSPDSQTLASGSGGKQAYLQLWNVRH